MRALRCVWRVGDKRHSCANANFEYERGWLHISARCCCWLDADWGVPTATVTVTDVCFDFLPMTFVAFAAAAVFCCFYICAVPSAAGTTFYLDSAAPYITWKKKIKQQKKYNQNEMKQLQIWLGNCRPTVYNVMLFTTNWTYTNVHTHTHNN